MIVAFPPRIPAGQRRHALALWLSRNAFAQSVPLVRYDIASPAGRGHAGDLRQRDARDARAPESDPLSWLWQWYTHFVNGTTTKANEITRIFGTDVDAAERAGQRDVEHLPVPCRAEHQPLPAVAPHVRVLLRTDHPRGQRTRGLRAAVLGLHLERSAQARHPADPVPLPQRSGVRRAVSPRSHVAGQHAASRSTRTSRATRWTSRAAMAGRLQHRRHGAGLLPCDRFGHPRHASTSWSATRKNMGAVPYAARDPLFWVHHANIDRMWASWNAQGRRQPGHGDLGEQRQFVFADRTRQRVTGRTEGLSSTPRRWAMPTTR